MDLLFNTTLADGYKSQAQIVRILSENWMGNNMFCPCCGRLHIVKYQNNKPVADFYCPDCNEIFELKSKNGNIGKKIVDGAYHTAIERISSFSNPELFVLQYTKDYCIKNLTLIPKFFFTPSIIEKRKPLSSTARRAGWVGSNILFSAIPPQGKIKIIQDGKEISKDMIVDAYSKSKRLSVENIENRGWLFDVLLCVNNMKGEIFSLSDIYLYCDFLGKLHPKNNNIQAKIRQQLQILRDKGFIEFCRKGIYRKTENS